MATQYDKDGNPIEKPIPDLADKMLGNSDQALPSTVPGKPAQPPADPLHPDKQTQLDTLLESFRKDMERNSGTFAASTRDQSMRGDLLKSIETGLALNKQRPGQGMDIDSALAALHAASGTNRLEYATTNSQTGADLAERLGLGSRTPEDRYGNGGKPFKLADAMLGVNAETKKQALTLDQIWHPEKFREEKLFSTTNGVARISPDNKADIIPGTEPEKITPTGTAQPVKDPETGETIGHYVDGKFVPAGKKDTSGEFTDRTADSLFESRVKVYKDSLGMAMSPDDYYQQTYDPATGAKIPGAVENRAMESRLRDLNARYEKYGQDVPYSFGGSAKAAAPAAQPPAVAKPAIEIGTEKGGYVFQGGDPAKAESWRKK